jgi:hypothetical protein
MDIIQIGSFAIIQKWLLLGLAVLFGLMFLKTWLRRFQKEENQKLFELLLNTLFIGFLIWKISLFLFEPTLIWKSPFSLLYFNGGNNGLVLAIVLSIIYFTFKAQRKSISNLTILQTVFVFSLVVLSLYHTSSFIFQEKNHNLHFLLGFIAIFLLVLGLKKRLTANWIFSSVILFAFINLIISFIYINLENKLLIFTAEQWLYILLSIFALIFWDKKLQI